MKTVSEISRLSGVSVRTLHHYDRIGLLHPAQVTPAGYRLYGDREIERLQMILVYRELKFSLQDVKRILNSDDYDRNRALDQQIELLEMQHEHIENLIAFARGIRLSGVKHMDFSAFDTSKLDDYAKQAKAAWGNTDAYREFEQRDKRYTKADRQQHADGLMALMARFGEMRRLAPDSDEAQALVGELRRFITDHYYTCTVQILSGLGQMYNGGGSMTENINRAGGEGTADFASRAIKAYCDKTKE